MFCQEDCDSKGKELSPSSFSLLRGELGGLIEKEMELIMIKSKKQGVMDSWIVINYPSDDSDVVHTVVYGLVVKEGREGVKVAVDVEYFDPEMLFFSTRDQDFKLLRNGVELTLSPEFCPILEAPDVVFGVLGTEYFTQPFEESVKRLCECTRLVRSYGEKKNDPGLKYFKHSLPEGIWIDN